MENIKIIISDDKDINIQSKEFDYSNLKSLYVNADGIGFQTNDPNNEKGQMKMCSIIVKAIRDYLRGIK